MKFRYVINPLYEAFAKDILDLPHRFDKEGKILYNPRNCIKCIEVSGVSMNVKSFKVPHFLNRIVYRYFRKTKAERSYLNAQKLLSMGVNTPTPIAYIVEEGISGIFRSYYITEQIKVDYHLGDLVKRNIPDFQEVMRSTMAFIASFHKKGVFFLDLSVGNLLIQRQPTGEIKHFLVDINRMTFYNRPLTCSEGVKAFCRLDSPYELKELLLREYARQSNFDFDKVISSFHYHAAFDNFRRDLKQFRVSRIFSFAGRGLVLLFRKVKNNLLREGL